MAKNDFFIREDQKLERIDISQIIFLEVVRNYVHLFINKDDYFMVRVTLEVAVGCLPDKEFAQISRERAVAVRLIRTITRETVIIVMAGENVEFPLSRVYRKGLLDCLTVIEKKTKRKSRSRRGMMDWDSEEEES